MLSETRDTSIWDKMLNTLSRFEKTAKSWMDEALEFGRVPELI